MRAMAAEKPEWNYLGLEIRRPTAAVALERAAALGTRNCHVVCCNANVRVTPNYIAHKWERGRGRGSPWFCDERSNFSCQSQARVR